MEKQRPRTGQWLLQSDTASQAENWDLNSGLLNSSQIRPVPPECRAWGRDYSIDASLGRCKPRLWEWGERQGGRWGDVVRSSPMLVLAQRQAGLLSSQDFSPAASWNFMSRLGNLETASFLTNQMVGWWIKNPASSPVVRITVGITQCVDSQIGWPAHLDSPARDPLTPGKLGTWAKSSWNPQLAPQALH